MAPLGHSMDSADDAWVDSRGRCTAPLGPTTTTSRQQEPQEEPQKTAWANLPPELLGVVLYSSPLAWRPAESKSVRLVTKAWTQVHDSLLPRLTIRAWTELPDGWTLRFPKVQALELGR